MRSKKYKIRVIRGAFIDKSLLDSFKPVLIEKDSDPDWQSIEEIIVEMEDIKKLQESMVKHSLNSKAPWYLDGYEENDKDKMLVAFGSDDGENGKVFIFSRSDVDKIKEVQDYGVSKGIPANQMSFGEIDF